MDKVTLTIFESVFLVSQEELCSLVYFDCLRRWSEDSSSLSCRCDLLKENTSQWVEFLFHKSWKAIENLDFELVKQVWDFFIAEKEQEVYRERCQQDWKTLDTRFHFQILSTFWPNGMSNYFADLFISYWDTPKYLALLEYASKYDENFHYFAQAWYEPFAYSDFRKEALIPLWNGPLADLTFQPSENHTYPASFTGLKEGASLFVSKEQFQKNLETLSRGILYKNFSWKKYGVILAGGTLVNCLSPNFDPKRSSDIDIWQTRGMKFDSFMATCFGHLDMEQTTKTTMTTRFKDVVFQYINTMGTPLEIIESFDLDCVRAYYDGTNIYALPSFYLASQAQIVNWRTRSIKKERYQKWVEKKGYGISPEAQISSWGDKGYETLIGSVNLLADQNWYFDRRRDGSYLVVGLMFIYTGSMKKYTQLIEERIKKFQQKWEKKEVFFHFVDENFTGLAKLRIDIEPIEDQLFVELKMNKESSMTLEECSIVDTAMLNRDKFN